ncbi:MAG TPA: isochorismatase family cysteine hydrolase [Nitrososphaerales archaeon]|nr:isochorismatase family cysteine hydrolase [Nitrososphaerales archaeon]
MSQHQDSRLSKPALVVWDMQYGIAQRAFNLDEIVQKITTLRDAFHASGLPVIYSQHTGLPYEYLSAASLASYKRRGIDPKTGFMREGSKEWQIVEELAPAKEDLVLRKHTASFFFGTMLDQMLRNRGIDTLVLAGVSTEAGIEGTARNASYLGYLPVVVEDAVGSSDKEAHEKALWLMRKMFDVRSAEATIASVTPLR